MKQLGFAVRDPGDIVRGMEEFPELTVWELCPECGDEVEIPAYGRSVCPQCGAPILPCAMCERCTEPCVYDAVTYNAMIYPELQEICYGGRCMSDREWSEETGIPRMTIRYRVLNGWPLDKVFSTERRTGGGRNPGTKNRRYSAHAPTDWPGDTSTRTVREWSKISGIPTHVLYARMRKGKTMGQALVEPYLPTEERTYTHDGRTLTVAEWSEASGIPRYTLYQRLGDGLTIGEALNKPYRPAKRPTASNNRKHLTGWFRRFRR